MAAANLDDLGFWQFDDGSDGHRLRSLDHYPPDRTKT
jgi:hypothetical protein